MKTASHCQTIAAGNVDRLADERGKRVSQNPSHIYACVDRRVDISFFEIFN